MTPAAHEIDPRHLLEQMLLIRAYEEAIVAGSDAHFPFEVPHMIAD